MYFCKNAPGPHCRGVHSIVIMKQDFSWTKWGGGEIRAYFCQKWGIFGNMFSVFICPMH